MMFGSPSCNQDHVYGLFNTSDDGVIRLCKQHFCLLNNHCLPVYGLLCLALKKVCFNSLYLFLLLPSCFN